MTKHVRIENADNSEHKVVVEVWERGWDGAPDKKIHEHFLSHPTAMASDYLTQDRYMVVREREKQ